ncbi:MAG: acetyl-CoA carboxylase biotin carboxyl carrier protein [Campylobacterales bacterium]
MKVEQIKELIELFDASTLSKMNLKEGDFELSLEKGGVVAAPVVMTTPAPAPVAAASAPAATESSTTSEQTSGGELITSPMVGTFYRAPSPDAPPFVEVGSIVKKGKPLCILEAMKIMNELEAEFDCKILEILATDGRPVEYDMPLFRVERI